jgi:hypothetical protein
MLLEVSRGWYASVLLKTIVVILFTVFDCRLIIVLEPIFDCLHVGCFDYR